MSSRWCISSNSPFLSRAHVCVPWLPVTAWSLQFSSQLPCACVSSVCDGTRCPWCYYPRTLPGRAGGRFPPIIVISNGQPGGRERPREKGGGWFQLSLSLALSLSLSFSPPLSVSLWFCPWQQAAKVRGLCLMLDFLSAGRANVGYVRMHKQETGKTSHTHTKTKSTFACSFYFQAPGVDY